MTDDTSVQALDDDGDDGPDPLEGLQAVSEETALHVERIGATAEAFKKTLGEVQSKLKDSALGDEAKEAYGAILDAEVFLLDEFHQTCMSLLNTLAKGACDNFQDVRDWGEELESDVGELVGEPEGGADGSALLPDDAQAIQQLLGEFHHMLSASLGELEQGSEQYNVMSAHVGHIAEVLSRVQAITVQPEAAPTP